MTDFGIDISHHNQVDDWHAVRGNNISFVSVKVTESTDFTDDAAGKHADGARAAGIHVGGYHFARGTDVAGQVSHFAANLRAHGLLSADSLAPMLDMEVGTLGANANPFVANFIRTLRDQTGIRRVLVYGNLDWWRNILRPDEWADDDVSLWIARYNGRPGQPGWSHPRLALHQHSDKGVVPGIPAHVDRDATVGTRTVGSVLIG
ncbi:MAG TPA: glycoside hydrolase family 25 protein [Pseudonocardiaceae bacterium]|jgi:GH25 family lysozyme M1 (1,4-beta-N-acetylmuramidase)|nr:glycoside hydrolase family 25 protein [Pseudonocardiaceae bacterium]